MKLFLITVLLCWISVSVAEFYTAELQPNGNVTMMCSNFSYAVSHIFWFKLDSTSNVSCICTMKSPDSNATMCERFQNGKFSMTSNITTVFLKIKQVDLSDSGLYFCGFRSEGKPVIFSATYLKVQVSPVGFPHGLVSLTSVILAAVTVSLILVVIGMVFIINKLQTATQRRKPESERRVETCAVYAAGRWTRQAD